MRIDSFTMTSLADLHVHLRQGPILGEVIKHVGRYCDVCLAMPNTVPLLDNQEALRWYRDQISTQPASLQMDVWTTFALCETHSSDDIGFLASMPDLMAAKIYPRGLTTNSDHGISWETISRNPENLGPCLDALAESGLTLCLHAETPMEECSNLEETETSWIAFLEWIIKHHPRLRVVVEHVTTARMIRFVAQNQSRPLGATITPQHLLWTQENLYEGGLNLLRYCKPVYKFPPDRTALWKAVWECDNVFLGSDLAPHALETKVCRTCKAGVYSAPFLPELLAEIFEDAESLDIMEEFCCLRGPRFYGGNMRKRTKLQFHKEPWVYRPASSLASCWDDHEFRWKAIRIV